MWEPLQAALLLEDEARHLIVESLITPLPSPSLHVQNLIIARVTPRDQPEPEPHSPSRSSKALHAGPSGVKLRVWSLRRGWSSGRGCWGSVSQLAPRVVEGHCFPFLQWPCCLPSAIPILKLRTYLEVSSPLIGLPWWLR